MPEGYIERADLLRAVEESVAIADPSEELAEATRETARTTARIRVGGRVEPGCLLEQAVGLEGATAATWVLVGHLDTALRYAAKGDVLAVVDP